MPDPDQETKLTDLDVESAVREMIEKGIPGSMRVPLRFYAGVGAEIEQTLADQPIDIHDGFRKLVVIARQFVATDPTERELTRLRAEISALRELPDA